MSNYEIITVTGMGDTETQHVILDLGDGSFKSFPVDENNPEYVAWKNAEDGILPTFPGMTE
jgi:hypothetical protein